MPRTAQKRSVAYSPVTWCPRRTNLEADERDDDLLQALRMSAGDGLFEQLEHILQDLITMISYAYSSGQKKVQTSTRVLIRLMRCGISR
jgi:hypothetical protein